MPGALVVVFWCWTAMAFAIVVRRAFRKVSHRPPAVTSPVPSVRSPEPPTVAPVMPATPAVPADVEPKAEASATIARPATLAEALQGIRMPCDLLPLMGSDVDLDRRAAFVTVGYPADAVAPEVADEIERLGMVFNATSECTAIAERDDVRVLIAVHAVGASVNGIANPAYPSAPEHSVVVEFELA